MNASKLIESVVEGEATSDFNSLSHKSASDLKDRYIQLDLGDNPPSSEAELLDAIMTNLHGDNWHDKVA